MTSHPHKSLRQEPVIWEYGEYRITQADDRNLKIFQFRQPTEDWGKKAGGRRKGGQRKEATWVWCSYHSSLFDALKALIDKVLCDPATASENGLNQTSLLLNRIAAFEEDLQGDLEDVKERVKV